MSADIYKPTAVEVEPTQRWVRVKFDGQYVADSKRVMMLREPGHLPVYYFPRDDVRTEMLKTAGTTQNNRFFDVEGSSKKALRGAYSHPHGEGSKGSLHDYIAFRWDMMDHWYEEEEEIFVHPRDPYKRIDAIPSSRHVRITLDGQTIAETTRPHLLFETRLPTRYYIPAEDVNMDMLDPSDKVTRCPYKGIARYWHVKTDTGTYQNLVWSYPDPIPECPKIAGLLCFFNEKTDIYVDDDLQDRPQTPWS